MSSVSRTVLDYWDKLFAGDAIFKADSTSSLILNPHLGLARRVMILERTDGSTKVALTPLLAGRLGIAPNSDMPVAALRRRLAEGGVALHDPDCLFYFPTAPAQVPAADPARVPRRLTKDDREAFDAFRSETSEQDLEDAYVELDHWAVFGCFDGDRLVSAASMYPWDGAPIADLGVLTLPDVRARGYARALVRAIAQFARDRGYEPQYRCQLDNAASMALAKSSGLALFGRWEVIRSDANRP